MGYLSPQSIYSRDLSRRRIWLRPPEPDYSLLLSPPGEGIYFGRSKLMAVPVYWDFHKLANPHVAVVGMTGSGKSYFVKTFITRAYRQWGTSSLILDWAGEYTPWVKQAGGTVVKLGKEHGLNVLDCRPDSAKGKQYASDNIFSSTPRFRVEQLISSFKLLGALGSSPRAARILQELLEGAYSLKRINPQKPLKTSLSAKRLPTLRDALALGKKRLKRSKEDHDLALAIHTLEFFCPAGVDYFSKSGGMQLDALVGKGVVSADLSSLPHEAHRSLAGLTILQMLKERMRASGWMNERGLRLLVVADEAWKIAQDDNSDLVAIMREGRKYAFGLIVASQNPTDLSPTIFSNAGTLLSFRLGMHEHREIIRNSLQLRQNMSDSLERMPVGTALARFGWSAPGETAIPFLVSIEGEAPARPLVLKVNSMDIEVEREVMRKRLWRLGLTDTQISSVSASFERADRTLDADELARLMLGFGLSRSVILSFMRSLGVPDEQLVSLFSRLASRSLGVQPNQLIHLEVSDEKH